MAGHLDQSRSTRYLVNAYNVVGCQHPAYRTITDNSPVNIFPVFIHGVRPLVQVRMAWQWASLVSFACAPL
jgi:hypothetical protein